MRAIDNLQKICYCDFRRSVRGRVNSLWLSANPFASFLSAAERVRHVVHFDSGYIAASLLHSHHRCELSSAAVRRISRHCIRPCDAFGLVAKRVHRHSVLYDVPDHRAKPRIGQQTIRVSVQPMSDAVCVNTQ